MKYILKQIDDISGRGAVTTIEFNTDTMDDVLQHVDLFIRGCGFFPPQGAVLDYIEDQFPDWVGQQDSEWNTPVFEPKGTKKCDETDYSHHESYFDTERNK